MTKEKVKKPGDPGFSLTELLIAVTVMAALSAVAVPMLSSSMRSMQLAADAQNISSTLSSARLSAKSLMTPYRISIDLNDNKWQLEKFNRVSGNFELQNDVYQLSSGITNSGITFLLNSGTHPGIFPSQSSNTITFNSRGIPVDINNTPTTNNIIYISKSGTDYAISVSLTGKVQVWKENGGHWDIQ
ncbi:MAG: GspH/FimT family pseudopilin [Acidobacteria bacterium]|nr:GspH/FimT family pseudopilin [Acidobacteriota bacterium]